MRSYGMKICKEQKCRRRGHRVKSRKKKLNEKKQKEVHTQNKIR